MNKNFKKTLALLISVMAVAGTTFSAFADTVDTTNQAKQERKMPENMIIGKITSIDVTNVTIQVATRKEMERKENDEKGNPPEKPVDGQVKQDGIISEKPNMDNMFILTGENKTINIASANFGKKFDRNNNTDSQKGVGVDKTYADYQIGDYVIIECTDATYQVAKTMHDSKMMGGGMRGGFGNKEKKGEITN